MAGFVPGTKDRRKRFRLHLFYMITPQKRAHQAPDMAEIRRGQEAGKRVSPRRKENSLTGEATRSEPIGIAKYDGFN